MVFYENIYYVHAYIYITSNENNRKNNRILIALCCTSFKAKNNPETEATLGIKHSTAKTNKTKTIQRRRRH